MFFSTKPNAILLVDRDSATLYPKSSSGTLSLPQELVAYLEVRDKSKLTESLVEFGKTNKVRGKRLLIVLHKDIVFQKAITIQKDDDQQKITTDFEQNVPFDPSERKVLSIRQKDRLFLFGANQDFYSVLTRAMEQSGAKVEAVVPGLVYGLTDADKLSPTKFSQICDATKLTKTANFLN